jgi:hypothetical protein
VRPEFSERLGRLASWDSLDIREAPVSRETREGKAQLETRDCPDHRDRSVSPDRLDPLVAPVNQVLLDLRAILVHLDLSERLEPRGQPEQRVSLDRRVPLEIEDLLEAAVTPVISDRSDRRDS